MRTKGFILILFALILGYSLIISGCMNSFKLVYDRDVKVFDRETGKECQMVWFGSNSEGADVGYGLPCDVIIRRKAEPIQPPKF